MVLLSGCITGPEPKITTTTMPYEQAKVIVNEAIKNKDTTSCDQMTEQVKKDWCLWTVALSSKESSQCAQITHNIYRAGCYMGIAIAVKDAAACDKIDFDDSNKIFATKVRCKAIIGGNIAACDQLTGVQKDICYLTVGTANKDMSQCNKVANKDTKDLCVTEVNAAG